MARSLAPLLVAIGTLTPDPENARLHDGASIDVIRASLAQFGQQKPVIALTDGTVIAGNGMLTAALALGWRSIACVRWAGTKADAVAFAVSDNRTAELSRWDDLLVARAMVEMADAAPVLAAACGFTEAEIREFRRALDLGDAVPVEAPEIKIRLEFHTAAELAEYERWAAGLAREFPAFEVAGSRVAAYVNRLGAE